MPGWTVRSNCNANNNQLVCWFVNLIKLSFYYVPKRVDTIHPVDTLPFYSLPFFPQQINNNAPNGIRRFIQNMLRILCARCVSFLFSLFFAHYFRDSQLKLIVVAIVIPSNYPFRCDIQRQKYFRIQLLLRTNERIFSVR